MTPAILAITNILVKWKHLLDGINILSLPLWYRQYVASGRGNDEIINQIKSNHKDVIVTYSDSLKTGIDNKTAQIIELYYKTISGK